MNDLFERISINTIYIFRFYPQRLDLPWDDNSIRVRAQMPSIKRVGLIKSMQT